MPLSKPQPLLGAANSSLRSLQPLRLPSVPCSLEGSFQKYGVNHDAPCLDPPVIPVAVRVNPPSPHRPLPAAHLASPAGALPFTLSHLATLLSFCSSNTARTWLCPLPGLFFTQIFPGSSVSSFMFRFTCLPSKRPLDHLVSPPAQSPLDHDHFIVSLAALAPKHFPLFCFCFFF